MAYPGPSSGDGGGLSLDGQRWIRPYDLGWLISEAGVKKMWRYHCITALREAHRSGKLRWEAKSAFLKAFPCFNKLLSNLYRRTWYVHIGAALLDPSATVRYIGRYTKRAVLAEYRITHYDGQGESPQNRCSVDSLETDTCPSKVLD